jgi:hypothetical protein
MLNYTAWAAIIECHTVSHCHWVRSRKSLSGIIVEYTRDSLNTLRHRVPLSQNHITLSQCCYLKVNIFLRSYHIIGWIFYKQAVIISKIGAQTWKEYVIDSWYVSEIRRYTLLNLVIRHCINSKCCQILSTQGAFTRYNTQDRVNIQDCNHVNKTTKITIARRVW